MAPRIVVVNAEDVRRKRRLLAFLGLALPDGSSRRKTSSIKDRPAPAIWHRAPQPARSPATRIVIPRLIRTGASEIPCARSEWTTREDSRRPTFLKRHSDVPISLHHPRFVSHLPCVICHLSSVICHLSSVICHLSSVICHLSSVICHLSSVICHLSSFAVCRRLTPTLAPPRSRY
jgi:hypothetical protein